MVDFVAPFASASDLEKSRLKNEDEDEDVAAVGEKTSGLTVVAAGDDVIDDDARTVGEVVGRGANVPAPAPPITPAAEDEDVAASETVNLNFKASSSLNARSIITHALPNAPASLQLPREIRRLKEAT